MQTINDTPLHVALVPSSEDGDRIAALLLAAVTYRIGEDGELQLAGEQRKLRLTPVDKYTYDAHLEKTCASVTASGHVYPKKSGDSRGFARLSVGDVSRSIAAFGTRVWQEGILSGALVPTAPLPFEAIPMRWENAYGGSVFEPASVIELDGQEVIVPPHDEAYPLNLIGTGFYPSARHALHKPLPQLEDPENLITSIDDRPEPVGLSPYPLHGGLRAASVLRDGKIAPDLLGRLSSHAAPRGTFAEIPPGTSVSVEGMRPKGQKLGFTVPESPVSVEMSVGESRERFDLRVDAIDIDADRAEVRILYRGLARYPLLRYEERIARFVPTEQLIAMRPKGGF